MKRIYRRISLILSLAGVLSLTSCGSASGDGDKVSDDAASGVSSAETIAASVPETETAAPDPGLEAVDYDGLEVGILVGAVSEGDYYIVQSNDFQEVGKSYELDDAIYKRNLKLMEKYNISLVTSERTNDLAGAVKKGVLSGDFAYDFANVPTVDGFSLAQNGCLRDLNELPYADFTQPWFMTTVIDDTRVAGKNFFAVGNMSVQTYYSISIMYFNKRLFADYASTLESPYDMVRDGSWVYDDVIELCRGFSADLDADSLMTEADQYGMAYNNAAWMAFYYGGDELFAKRDSDGRLYFDASSEKIYNILSKIIPVSNDPSVCLFAEDTDAHKYSVLGDNYRGFIPQTAFIEGRALLWIENMYGVPTLRNMDCDFGILPVPKYDENQENYTSYSHSGQSRVLTVPLCGTENDDMLGRLLTDTAYMSDIVRDALIETSLKSKNSRDEESMEMVDIITSDFHIDIALAFTTLDNDIRACMNKNNADIASLFASKADSYNASLKKLEDAITNQ